ncbi:hypothetical protein RB594_003017 [Gaeumannomyces avenae]
MHAWAVSKNLPIIDAISMSGAKVVFVFDVRPNATWVGCRFACVIARPCRSFGEAQSRFPKIVCIGRHNRPLSGGWCALTTQLSLWVFDWPGSSRQLKGRPAPQRAQRATPLTLSVVTPYLELAPQIPSPKKSTQRGHDAKSASLVLRRESSSTVLHLSRNTLLFSVDQLKRSTTKNLPVATMLDKLVGLAMLVAASVVFLYYSVWTLIMPFVDSDHPLQNVFPPRVWAIRIPVILILLGSAVVGSFLSVVMIRSNRKKAAKAKAAAAKKKA